MREWRELVKQWAWAGISDAQFIFLADEMGMGGAARDLIQKDLETP